MRTVNAEGQALLDRMKAGEQIPIVQLVELHFDVVQRISPAGVPLLWGGPTWQPVGCRVSTLEADVDELADLSLGLPAVTEAQLAVALVEDDEGKTVRVFDALVNPDTGVVADAVPAWAGALNSPQVSDGAEATLTVTAEHRGKVARRPKVSRYTNDEQQRIAPGDTMLDVDPATDAAAVVWPAASFYQQ